MGCRILVTILAMVELCRKKKKAARRSMLRYIPIDTLADFDYFHFNFKSFAKDFMCNGFNLYAEKRQNFARRRKRHPGEPRNL